MQSTTTLKYVAMAVAILALLTAATAASGDTPGGVTRFVSNEATVNVILAGDTPPISDDLATFFPMLNRPSGENVPVGFNGADLGGGPGDGNNEPVLFSFEFNRFAEIVEAQLTLELTLQGDIPETDELFFADVGNMTGFGTSEIAAAAVGRPTTVTFDLLDLDGLNLAPILLDGDLDVVYVDDAIIHNARLVIDGRPAPPAVDILHPAASLADLGNASTNSATS